MQLFGGLIPHRFKPCSKSLQIGVESGFSRRGDTRGDTARRPRGKMLLLIREIMDIERQVGMSLVTTWYGLWS
jgi:hypothetical protein